MPKVNLRNEVGAIIHTVSNRVLSNHTAKNIYGMQLPRRCLAPAFANHCHHCNRRRCLTRMGTATAIAICVVVIVSLSHCLWCRVGGPAVNDDAILEAAPAAPLLPPLGAMDPRCPLRQ